ncbi:MAG: sulfite exporter TauE/SafE family protein [Planctomycetes bacterium]|nr:sulfite exporter TauE/SafE family protein [Planctomycetota bacterium]
MTPEVGWMAAALLVAGFVQGTVGFGFGMISMAVLPHLFGVRASVPVVSLLGLVMCLGVWWRWRAAFVPRAVVAPLVGSVVGAPLGAYFLASIARGLALGLLGAVMLAVALPSLLAAARGADGRVRRLEGVRRYGFPIGVVSGLFGGAFNSGGPPVILYGQASGWAPAAFRSQLQAIFFCSSLAQLAMLGARGVATRESLELAGLGLPAVLVGLTLGGRCAERLDTRAFRVTVWALLAALGLNFVRQAL